MRFCLTVETILPDCAIVIIIRTSRLSFNSGRQLDLVDNEQLLYAVIWQQQHHVGDIFYSNEAFHRVGVFLLRSSLAKGRLIQKLST